MAVVKNVLVFTVVPRLRKARMRCFGVDSSSAATKCGKASMIVTSERVYSRRSPFQVMSTNSSESSTETSGKAEFRRIGVEIHQIIRVEAICASCSKNIEQYARFYW